jgi:hypothetical protein
MGIYYQTLKSTLGGNSGHSVTHKTAPEGAIFYLEHYQGRKIGSDPLLSRLIIGKVYWILLFQ